MITEPISQDIPDSGAPNVSAVVVTYNPSPDVVENVKTLLEQVSNVIVVDNASEAAARRILEELSELDNVSVIYRDNNGGIAAALNEGVQLARAQGAAWVGTFDQDSSPAPFMVKHMLEAYENHPRKETVAILAPVYKDEGGAEIRNFFVDDADASREYNSVMTVMTSGNLVRSAVFDEVGLFNEQFFIDYVDHEFCLRCKCAGLDILQIRSAILTHGLGNKTSFRVFGREISVTNHSPLRRYYITRNRLYTYMRFRRVYPGWVRTDLASFIKESVRLMIFERSRTRKAAAMLRGVLHAGIGKTGPYK